MITILGLLAKSGHGKTTVARHLADAFGAEIRSLADPLKRAARSVFGFTEAQLWGSQADKEAVDPRYGFSPRWLLQRLGTEGLRREFGEDIHVQALVRGLRSEEAARAPGSPHRLYVVDDVRFPNDARFIAAGGLDHCGAVLRIVATDVPAPPHTGHPSELAIDTVREEDIAATVVSSRALGVAHLLSEVDRTLLGAPAFAVVRNALSRAAAAGVPTSHRGPGGPDRPDGRPDR